MYVKRDQQGHIVAVSAHSEPDFPEWLDPDDVALHEFLGLAEGSESDAEGHRLRRSDIELVRVLEDVIDLLTDKGVIHFTELPAAARDKLLRRKSLRQRVRSLDLVDEEDENESLMP